MHDALSQLPVAITEAQPSPQPSARVRLIAFYLPQYHPIRENDEWWGKGFTEWTNVTKARPLFRGHEQPHLPADLGFYDLRLPEAREAQAELARAYGIHAFCYYHYWFNGRRLLERPFNEVLQSGRPDFPFCLCWANESWTRNWDGEPKQILIQQRYSREDHECHMRYLATAFRDERYLRIDGKPVFLVYNSARISDAREMTEIWRETAYREGIGDIYLCKVESGHESRRDPRAVGFDAAVEFQPDTKRLGFPWRARVWELRRKLGFRRGLITYDYAWFVRKMLGQRRRPYPYFPCVTPGWDNTARRATGAFALTKSRPELYEKWLRTVIQRFEPPSPEENLIFVNAWNEWAEGNHLEPSLQWGRAYLEATKRALTDIDMSRA